MTRTTVLALLAAAAACAAEPTRPPADRNLQVTLANDRSLPSVERCPAPFGEDSDAWVAFAGGTLTLRGDRSYEWTYTVGDGYSYGGPDGVKHARSEGRTERGRYTVDPLGALRLHDVAGALVATGTLRTGGAELASASIPCPHAPPGTPMRHFTLTLR